MKSEIIDLYTNKRAKAWNYIEGTCSALLILVYTYASASKLTNYAETRRQMFNQPLPEELASVMAWLIPAFEIVIVLLLYVPKTRRVGYAISTLLIFIFTVYVLLALSGIFGEIACTCGGMISYLSWKAHLIFNIALLTLSITGFKLTERRHAS